MDETLGSLMIELGIEAGSFNGQMAEVSRRMGMAKAEFMAVGGTVKGFESTTEGAAAKAKMLTEQINLQRGKIALLESEYKEAADGLGANSKEAQQLKMKLDGTRGEMVKLESELKGLSDDEQTAEKKTKNLHSSLSGLGSGLKALATGAAKTAAAALAAVASAAGAAAAGALAMGQKALESADETQRLADVTGHTAEEIQVMAYQGKALGVETDTLVGAQGKLTKAMNTASDESNKMNESLADQQAKVDALKEKIAEVTAKHGDHRKELAKLRQELVSADAKLGDIAGNTGKATTAFEELGIKTVDAKGNLRDSKVVMAEAIDALGKMTNETERDALAQQIFGKSAMELNPIIKAGGQGLKDLADQAYKTGAVMSNDAVAGLDNFGDSIDALKISATGIAGTLLSGLLPQINQVVTMFQGLATAAADATKSGDWSGLAAKASAALQSLLGMALKALPGLMTIGASILTTLVTSIVAAVPQVIPQLTQGALQLINAVVGLLSSQGPLLITTAINAVGTLAMGLLQALPQMLTAAIQIVLALVNGIAAQLPTLIPAAVDCVLTLVQTLVDNLPMLIDAALKLILALVDGLIKALPRIIDSAPKIVTSLIDGIVSALPKLLDAALQIVLALVNAFPEYFPKILTAAVTIVGTVVAGLISAVGKVWEFIPKFWSEITKALGSVDWASLGKNIIDGLVSGLKAVGGKVWGALKGIVSSAVDSFKKFFGIASPSRYMRDQIGVHLGGGIAEGIAGSAGTVGKAMLGLRSQLNVGSMGLNLMPALAGVGAGAPGSSFNSTANTNNISIKVIIPGNFTVRSDRDIRQISQGIANETAAVLRARGVK